MFVQLTKLLTTPNLKLNQNLPKIHAIIRQFQSGFDRDKEGAVLSINTIDLRPLDSKS